MGASWRQLDAAGVAPAPFGEVATRELNEGKHWIAVGVAPAQFVEAATRELNEGKQWGPEERCDFADRKEEVHNSGCRLSGGERA